MRGYCRGGAAGGVDTAGGGGGGRACRPGGGRRWPPRRHAPGAAPQYGLLRHLTWALQKLSPIWSVLPHSDTKFNNVAA